MQWTQGIPDSNWDNDLTNKNGHFLQSSHWAAFQSALGRLVFYANTGPWQCLTIIERARTGTRLYCPYGPVAKTVADLRSALTALHKLAKQHNAVFVRMEPQLATTQHANLRALNLKPAFKDIQPRCTWVQDLTTNQDALLNQMTATNRNLWRNHTNKGITLHASTVAADIHYFIDMMQEVSTRNSITPHPDKYYRTMAATLLPRNAGKIYIAQHNGTPVASALCFDTATTRYYAHAAAHFSARKLHPGSALLVQMMIDAQKNSQKQFDFVGVAPAGSPPTHRWAGLTKFKQSFGGSYKTYLGTWELPVSKLRYAGYRTAYGIKTFIK